MTKRIFSPQVIQHDDARVQQEKIVVPAFKLGQPPLCLVKPPMEIAVPRAIAVTFTQIQYSQTVLLNFNTPAWPHVCVATLVPDGAIEVPTSVWT